MEWLSETLCVMWQYISSSDLSHYISAKWPAALLTILGTFAGAWFAFRFERRRQEQLTQDADVVAGYQARFALLSQQKAMSNIRKEYLEPKRKEEKSHRKLPKYLLLAEYPRVPFNGLGYFLKDLAGEEIPGETMAAEEGFFRFLRSLDQRNPRYDKMQRGIVQRAAQRAVQLALQQAVHRAEAVQQAAQQAARGVLDGNNVLTETLVKADTDSLYESVDDVLKHHEASIKRIDGYLKKRFAKYRSKTSYL